MDLVAFAASVSHPPHPAPQDRAKTKKRVSPSWSAVRAVDFPELVGEMIERRLRGDGQCDHRADEQMNAFAYLPTAVAESVVAFDVEEA